MYIKSPIRCSPTPDIRVSSYRVISGSLFSRRCHRGYHHRGRERRSSKGYERLHRQFCRRRTLRRSLRLCLNANRSRGRHRWRQWWKRRKKVEIIFFLMNRRSLPPLFPMQNATLCRKHEGSSDCLTIEIIPKTIYFSPFVNAFL